MRGTPLLTGPGSMEAFTTRSQINKWWAEQCVRGLAGIEEKVGQIFNWG